jgi:hypothetical protein
MYGKQPGMPKNKSRIQSGTRKINIVATSNNISNNIEKKLRRRSFGTTTGKGPLVGIRSRSI